MKIPKTKFIFVSGGVMSAVGKGVVAASISLLLKKNGFTVCPIKVENNLNVDFGTINPIEHGDPFLTQDGTETDIDLGNYERFLDQEVGYDNFMTMGQLYLKVIQNERSMFYKGEDVEPIPDVVNEIIRRWKLVMNKNHPDFIVIEFGGTVGEYENNNGLYYEAARWLGFDYKVAHVHVTYVPVPPHIGEPKTKPAQFGIKSLMNMGIYPNFIVLRSEIPIDTQRRYKFGHKFNIAGRDIFSNENLDYIERVPQHLFEQGMDKEILKFFKTKPKKKVELTDWKNYVKNLGSKNGNKIVISIVGKYFATGGSQLTDSYYALIKSIEHARVHNKISIDLKYVNSETNTGKMARVLKDSDGIIVPIGWGSRGVEGKIEAIKFARENKIPYLGLCYGMQLACVEYARNVLKIKDADTEENNEKTKNKIIHSIPFDEKYQRIKGDGTSMRLGGFDCILKKDSLAYEIYNKHKDFKNKSKNLINERHRHRFEFNNEYRKVFENSGFIFSGVSPDNFFVEYIELSKAVHPFFIATQSHPEYKSTPLHPHPVFVE
ncbi:CTP synthase, partial [Patescibacteria group bacterium]|nr:CTP synthase [Patescibacteria group bacterium]